MNWWTSVMDGAKSFGDGAAWVFSKAPITQAVSYAADTAFYVTEQVLALREAIPALIAPFKTRVEEMTPAMESVQKVIKGMGNVVFHDVLPVVAVNYVNNGIQSYFREGYSEEQGSFFAPYALFLSTLSLANYGVQLYNYRQATKLVAHTLVLDTIAPSAFNEHKALVPSNPTLCVEEDCNFKRKFKGSLRGTIGLALNDLVLWGISQFPYGGKQISWILGLYFYGEYITYMATPERCERHKGMKSESILSLGLAYTGTSALMNYALESTVGVPPYLYNRTLQHLLLLLHINVASHMSLPLVKPQKETSIPVDPLFLYDRTKRFIIDVVFAGLMKRVPIDFKPPEGAKPFIPLSTVFKFFTKILESDLEKVQVSEPGFFKQATRVVLPNMFHNPKNAVNDPVIKQFWPEIRSDLLNIIDIVESTKPIQTLTTGAKPIASTVKYTLPKILWYRFGLPIKLSEFLLSLSKKEDFWSFVTALKRWIERNDVSREIILTKINSKAGLHDTDKIIELPPDTKKTTTIPPSIEELKTPRPSMIADAKQLISHKPSSVITANSLFSTKQRKNLTSSPKIDEIQAVQYN
ncbi:Uncharacterised protein [Legionella sainthelensi]|uniref:hypothetical protein n=1 Tax=Legionella sainthelensi TaxID=28087 RepID=UPI000E209168|nr:hypothetical protein [Legionella sainthelensi]VEB32562.1 Uncharacterised protein [Legionella sainthelensi]